MIDFTPRQSGSRRKLFIRSAVVADRDNQKKALADKTTAYNNQVTAYNNKVTAYNKVKELQTMTADRDNQKKALADKTTAYNNANKFVQAHAKAVAQVHKQMRTLGLKLVYTYYAADLQKVSRTLDVSYCAFTTSKADTLADRQAGVFPMRYILNAFVSSCQTKQPYTISYSKKQAGLLCSLQFQGEFSAASFLYIFIKNFYTPLA